MCEVGEVFDVRQRLEISLANWLKLTLTIQSLLSAITNFKKAPALPVLGLTFDTSQYNVVGICHYCINIDLAGELSGFSLLNS